MSVNRVILLGTVDSQLHIHEPTTGSKIANFILVTSEHWCDANGETKSRGERHKISVFGDKLVGYVSANVKLGSYLYIEGQIEGRTWKDPQNAQTSSVDIVVRNGKGRLEMWP